MKKILMGAVLSASVIAGGMTATPAAAQRYDRYAGHNDGRYYGDGYYQDGYYQDGRYSRHHRNRYYRDRRCKGTSGAIIGGVLGALIGGEVGRGRYGGRSTTGTIVGAGAGALLGREVSRSDCRHR
jgi:hypothetical protein